jgi:hypothetical protein
MTLTSLGGGSATWDRIGRAATAAADVAVDVDLIEVVFEVVFDVALDDAPDAPVANVVAMRRVAATRRPQVIMSPSPIAVGG